MHKRHKYVVRNIGNRASKYMEEKYLASTDN